MALGDPRNKFGRAILDGDLEAVQELLLDPENIPDLNKWFISDTHISGWKGPLDLQAAAVTRVAKTPTGRLVNQLVA